MQVAASPYPASQPLYPYPNHYHHHHHPIPVTHDHELKRQYLGLLPPQQIIEICLTFDVHVPPYVKASIWPIDINAAITGLRKQAADAAAAATEAEGSSSSSSSTSSSSTAPPERGSQKQNGSGDGDQNSSTGEEDLGGGAIMDSLTADSSERPSPAPEGEGDQSKDGVEEPRPPDKEPTTTEENGAKEATADASTSSEVSSTVADGPPATEDESPSTSSASSTSTASTSTPTPATAPTNTTTTTTTTEPTPTPAAQQPPQSQPPTHPPVPAATPAAVPPPHQGQPMPVAYPHQPYGYPYAPYYPPPPPGYPYPQYPAYPHQPQHAHAHAYPPPPPPAALPPVPPPAPPPMPIMQQDGQSPDDLPSYEEMIVEALMDSNDPEGCAPKDLFTWMAARYPVQSNFRPSASQALQKAYKRGRLEKSSNNKYRLNAAWEGGNTSRRTTRRPQTHTHTLNSSNAAPSSPFTNAPLVHHHHHQPQPQPQQHQPYGYGAYPYPQAAYAGFANANQPAAAATPATAQAQQPTVPASGTTTTAAATDATTSGTSADKTSDAKDKEVSDAYEAAQNILKAINFGSLLQLPPEDTQDATNDVPQPAAGFLAAGSVQAQPQTAQHQPQTLLAALSGAQQQHNESAAAAAAAATTGVQQHHAPGAAEGAANAGGSRADLQAQLALLAAQLAELARVDESGAVAPAPAPQIAPAQVPQGVVQVPPPVIARPQEQQPQHQPMRGLFYHSPNPAQQQMQGQTHAQILPFGQVQAHAQPQPVVQPQQQDNQAPMASLFPPPPGPTLPTPAPTTTSVRPVEPVQMGVVEEETQNRQGSPMDQSGDANQQQPVQHPIGWGAPSSGAEQAQHQQVPQPQEEEEPAPSSDGLAPMEPMDDSALDGEYDSDEDDDDMEEVI